MQEKNEEQIQESLEQLEGINETGDSVYCAHIKPGERQEGDIQVHDPQTQEPIFLRRIDYQEARRIIKSGDNIAVIWKESKLGKKILEDE
jgi:hypothetical protein